MEEYVVYESAEDWSALYVNGKLDRVADHYLIDERLRELCSVTTIQSESFLKGGNTYEDVARSLEEIEAWESEQEEARRLEAIGGITGGVAQAVALLEEQGLSREEALAKLESSLDELRRSDR